MLNQSLVSLKIQAYNISSQKCEQPAHKTVSRFPRQSTDSKFPTQLDINQN